MKQKGEESYVDNLSGNIQPPSNKSCVTFKWMAGSPQTGKTCSEKPCDHTPMANNRSDHTYDAVKMKDTHHHRKGNNQTKGEVGAESRTENLALLDNEDMKGSSKPTWISKSDATLISPQPSGTATGTHASVTKRTTPREPILSKKVSILEAEINTITKLMEEDTQPNIKIEIPKS